MTGTYIQPGNNINYVNAGTETIFAGTLVIMGNIAGIAATTIPPGELGSLATTGIFSFAKDNTAIEAGTTVYYDKTNDVVTSTESGNTAIGISVAAADASATTVNVRLNN